jgi:hypothetical protein
MVIKINGVCNTTGREDKVERVILMKRIWDLQI